jgi:signal transduction histidine kinase
MWTAIGFAIGLLVAAVLAREFTRRHVNAARAAERRARSAERLAEIGAMTGGLAHEIKNPLSTIGLNAQLLSEGVDDSDLDPDTKRRLGNRVAALRRETERLRGILQDFLEFAGQIRLDARPIDAGAIVSELVDFYHPEAKRLGVTLRADVPAGESLIARADPKLLKQALLNLMINATQAIAGPSPAEPGSPPRGEVILRARAHPATDDRAATITIHVIDTGPGIAPDVLARIFEPYFTTKAGGSGLGLPTARRIIEEHGGRLDVHSEPGRGTDFCMVLPVGEAG